MTRKRYPDELKGYDTSGELRTMEHRGTIYVTGRGELIPVEGRGEAREMIESMKKAPTIYREEDWAEDDAFIASMGGCSEGTEYTTWGPVRGCCGHAHMHGPEAEDCLAAERQAFPDTDRELRIIPGKAALRNFDPVEGPGLCWATHGLPFDRWPPAESQKEAREAKGEQLSLALLPDEPTD
jgi:hypothetical protein